MSQQLLARSNAPDTSPDHISSPVCMHAPEATYAPLYKADAWTHANTIESPFSQSLFTSSQGPRNPTACSGPPKQLMSSPSLNVMEESPSNGSRSSSGEAMDVRINAALNADRVVPDLSNVLSQRISHKRILGSASAHTSAEQIRAMQAPKECSQEQRLLRQRSSSMGASKPLRRARTTQEKEMDDLQAVLSYNLALQARTLELERSLAFKDKQIGALTMEMKLLRTRQEEDMCQDLDMIEEDGGRPQSLPANLLRSGCSASMDLDLDAQLLRLQKFFESHSLHEADVTGHGLDEGVMRQLKEFVRAGCQMAEEIFTPASACHHTLPLVIVEHSAMLPEQAALWREIAEKLQLSQAQKHQIGVWRSSVHAHMQRVQMERHSVLTEMMRTLLPGGLLLHPDAPRIFSDQLHSQGCLPLMKTNTDVSTAAKRLEENLAQERKLFASANTTLLQNILSPVQSARLMLEAWPAHCDCFAFATAAYQ